VEFSHQPAGDEALERACEARRIVETLEHALIRGLAVGLDSGLGLLGAQDPGQRAVLVGLGMELGALDVGGEAEDEEAIALVLCPGRRGERLGIDAALRRPELAADLTETRAIDAHCLPVAVLPREEALAERRQERRAKPGRRGVDRHHPELARRAAL